MNESPNREVQGKIDASVIAAKRIRELDLERTVAELQRRVTGLEESVGEVRCIRSFVHLFIRPFVDHKDP